MSENSVQVRSWTGDDQPTEAALRRQFAEEGLQPYRWSNRPGDVYSAHAHAYHKVLYVVSGSITFTLVNDNRQVTLAAGDRLDLPPGTAHAAFVGPQGVVCLEAQSGQ